MFLEGQGTEAPRRCRMEPFKLELESGTWGGDFLTEYVALLDKYLPDNPFSQNDRQLLLDSITTVLLAKTGLT